MTRPILGPALLVAALLSGACAADTPPADPPATTVTPDLSAMDAFWSLYDTLLADTDPTAAQWEALFATPAYEYLGRVEGREALFRELFPAVFKPSGDVDAVLSERPQLQVLVDHYRRVVAEEGELRAFQAALATGSLMSDARARAGEYLPQAAIDDPWWPTVVPVISHPDGTSHDGTIIVDLLLMRDAGDDGIRLFIAHEMHHAYAKRHWPAAEPATDDVERLVHALDQLRLEGTADLIDKPIPFEGGPYTDAYRQRYTDEYRRSEEILATVNDLLEQIDAGPAATATHAEAIWNALPFAGHPTGAFMARAILDALGHERLMTVLQSPFTFIRAYQEASGASGQSSTFSDVAMAVIGRLEPTSR